MTTLPARGVVLCSGSASSLRFLAARDPNFGKLYQITGLFADTTGASGLEFAQGLNIPTDMLDFHAWRKKNGVARMDLDGRERYFTEVLERIRPWQPDFFILSGLMRRITNPLLSDFEGRILNVHPALLSIEVGGKRTYTGLHVVERAMRAGDPTGSTVHLVTDEPDTGPIVAVSSPLPYQEGDDPDAHQERMKTACDGPAFKAALEKLIENGWPTVAWPH